MISAAAPGHIVFDGLLEGPLPSSPEFAAELRAWAAAPGKPLRFSLDLEHASFSVLASNDPVSIQAFTGSPQEDVRAHLEELVRLFPADVRPRLFSTIRSVEYRENRKVETLYAVVPNGTVETREREVDWKPAPPALPAQGRPMWQWAGMTAAALAAVLLMYFFGKPSAATWEGIRFDVSQAERYLRLEPNGSGGEGVLSVTVHRGETYPAGFEAFEEEERRLRAEKDLAGLMMLRAVAQGTVRLDYLDEQGKVIDSCTLRINELASSEKSVEGIPVDPRRKPAVFRVTY